MAKAKFSLIDLLNTKSKENPNNEVPRAGNDFKVELISVYQLEPNEDNFYSIDDVADLKDSIEMLGVQQNLVVKQISGTDKYKVIAGHRRRLASLQLAEEGKVDFELVPCRIETSQDVIREQIMLIYTNATTRKLSDWEQTEQIKRLKVLFKEYKKTHGLPGRVRELLAEALNISITQVGRIESVNKKLLPEFKEEFKKDNINFSTAAELSRLPVKEQEAVYEQHKVNGVTSLKEVKKIIEIKAKPVINEEDRLEAEAAGNYIRGVLIRVLMKVPSMKADIQECLSKLSVVEQYLPKENENGQRTTCRDTRAGR